MNILLTHTYEKQVRVTLFLNIIRVFETSVWPSTFITLENSDAKQDKLNCNDILKLEILCH